MGHGDGWFRRIVLGAVLLAVAGCATPDTQRVGVDEAARHLGDFGRREHPPHHRIAVLAVVVKVVLTGDLFGQHARSFAAAPPTLAAEC